MLTKGITVKFECVSPISLATLVTPSRDFIQDYVFLQVFN